MKIIDRVCQYIDYLKISPAQFEKMCGLSNGYIGKQRSRNADLGESITCKIIENCPEINIIWLITGKGEMLESKASHTVTKDSTSGNPYYAVDFIGGFSFMDNDQTITPAYYIDYKPFNEKGVIYVDLTGDSMKPEFNSGDIIAIKETTSPIEYLPYGEVYAIVTDDFRTVKRIGKSEKEGFIKLIPTNKQGGYAEQDIPASAIRKVFRVLGSIKKS